MAFIKQHHVLSLAVCRDTIPWCCSCFYCYLPERNLLVFTSDADTRHVQDFLAGGKGPVAGTIALETKVTGKIRGIQFAGLMRQLRGEELKAARREYLSHFPIARLTKLHLWGVEPDLIKLTDNRLGFGTKLIWQDSE
ncbi:MAG: hypothetical protein D4R67_04285 [Bacteroidetes bacterium]|nr:MAG: hypothetical protein D4R67_04285 [Bacteroidota bacterium]